MKRGHRNPALVKESVEAWQRESTGYSESSRRTIDSRTDVDVEEAMNLDHWNKEEDTSFVPEGAMFTHSLNNDDDMPVDDNFETAITAASTPLSSLTSLSTSRPGSPLLANTSSPLKVSLTPLLTPKQSRHPPASSSPKMPSSASSITRVSSPPIKLNRADSPTLLDEKSKTLQIIEEIKRKAHADAISSPMDEQKSYGELKELSDSSDAEDDFKLSLRS